MSVVQILTQTDWVPWFALVVVAFNTGDTWMFRHAK